MTKFRNGLWRTYTHRYLGVSVDLLMAIWPKVAVCNRVFRAGESADFAVTNRKMDLARRRHLNDHRLRLLNLP
jgi:hypothetical protein